MFLIIVPVIVILYIVMLQNTNSLISEVRNVFLWQVDSSETAGKPIDRYNDQYRSSKEMPSKIDFNIIRILTIHNFKDGYIWALYSYKAYDEDGEIITGSMFIKTKWKIHKENEKWEIVQIFEAP